eukprot:scaffold1903_cov396-Prasinococcus_capsulatus_cf.AAC.6
MLVRAPAPFEAQEGRPRRTLPPAFGPERPPPLASSGRERAQRKALRRRAAADRGCGLLRRAGDRHVQVIRRQDGDAATFQVANQESCGRKRLFDNTSLGPPFLTIPVYASPAGSPGLRGRARGPRPLIRMKTHTGSRRGISPERGGRM